MTRGKSCQGSPQGGEESNIQVFGVGMNPTTVRRKPRANHTIDKGLNSGSRGSVLLWREDFTVGVAEEDEVGMNLVKDPARSTTGKGSIKTDFFLGMG